MFKRIFVVSIITYSIFSSGATLKNSLPMRGSAEYKWYFLSIYQAKLWTSVPTNFYNGMVELELTYNRNIDGLDIVNQSEAELLKAGNDTPLVAQWKQQLLSIFPNVKKGESITAFYEPQKGITFYLNQTKEIGKIDNIQFAQHFLDIWLGEKVSDVNFKKRLIGETK